MLTDGQHTILMTVLTLIVECEKHPSENIQERLTERSNLPEEDVVWALEVLENEGRGWLEHMEHPKLPIRAYKPNKHFHNGVGDLDDLFAAWKRRQAEEGKLTFGGDPDDPDDEWVPGFYED